MRCSRTSPRVLFRNGECIRLSATCARCSESVASARSCRRTSRTDWRGSPALRCVPSCRSGHANAVLVGWESRIGLWTARRRFRFLGHMRAPLPSNRCWDESRTAFPADPSLGRASAAPNGALHSEESRRIVVALSSPDPARSLPIAIITGFGATGYHSYDNQNWPDWLSLGIARVVSTRDATGPL